jgi:hypothetical protein
VNVFGELNTVQLLGDAIVENTALRSVKYVLHACTVYVTQPSVQDHRESATIAWMCVSGTEDGISPEHRRSFVRDCMRAQENTYLMCYT